MIKLTIAYDGRGFAGSQRQGTRRTVQAELERAIAEFGATEVRTVFAGRTDRGVHAVGQVVGVVDWASELSEQQIAKALNAGLPRDVAVQNVERRSAGFHARYDATWREYRYRLWTGPRQPLIEGLVTQRERRIDRDSMSAAADRLVGTRDFASFAGDGEGVPGSERSRAPRGTTRTVHGCTVDNIAAWWPYEAGTGELLEIRVAADGFLPKMVRNFAGALIEVGLGKRSANWMDELIAGRDRRLAGMAAPVDGLILWKVGYEGGAVFGARDDGTERE